MENKPDNSASIPFDVIASTEPPAEEAGEAQVLPKPPRLEPTRYGDWELNGKCVDF